jgi:hypothetical protein
MLVLRAMRITRVRCIPGIAVARCYRLDPVAPAGPPAEGREGLVVTFPERTGILRVAVRVLAEDLRRIVVHGHGSSLVVLMGGRACGPGFVHLSERKPNDAISIPSAQE